MFVLFQQIIQKLWAMFFFLSPFFTDVDGFSLTVLSQQLKKSLKGLLWNELPFAELDVDQLSLIFFYSRPKIFLAKEVIFLSLNTFECFCIESVLRT